MNTTSVRLIPVLIFSLLSPLALAMGDNSTESKTPDCPSGQVYDSATQKCVPDKSSSLSDQDKTNYAYHLAKKGEYQAALNLLDSLKNNNTAEAWNYRGYATRKDTNNLIWRLPASVVIGVDGTMTATATSSNSGAVAALAGTITTINTPTRGWASVTNPAAATVGAPAETDAELRIRQGQSVALPFRRLRALTVRLLTLLA